MTPKKKKTQSGDNWQVEVVAYDDLTLAPGAVPAGTLKRVDIDKLLDTLVIFAESAGQKLNTIDICPSELTIEGNVSLEVGGGALVFGVSAGISVSMTWTFEETVTRPREKRRTDPPPPDE